MLVNGDFKALEWLGAVYLSKDPIGYEEIRNGVDQHADNQRVFGLPSRLIAKTFVFRLIYGGSAYAYANDADFEGTSTEQSFWQSVIDKFYGKYSSIRRWHEAILEEVMKTGRLEIPTGRVFQFERKKGQWPRTQILNYPVQGLGADLMVLARLLLWKRLRSIPGILFVSTVHDSIMLDVTAEKVDLVARSFFESWDEIPTEFEKQFGVPFDLPTKVEVAVGADWKHLEEIKR